MMDLDEALERVCLEGAIAARPEWTTGDGLYRYFQGQMVMWNTTRDLTIPDRMAEDWQIVGRLQ